MLVGNLALAVLVLFSYVRYFSSLNMSAIPITKSRSEYVLLRVLYNGTCWTHRFRGNVLLVAFFLSYWMWNLTSWARLRTGLLQAWYHGRERSTADTDLHFEEHRQGKNQWRRAEQWVTRQSKHRKALCQLFMSAHCIVLLPMIWKETPIFSMWLHVAIRFPTVFTRGCPF